MSRLRVALGAAAMMTAMIGTAAAQATIALEVRVAEGLVRGQVVDGVNVYRAIPYAAPPVGALRFRPPQPAAVRHDVFDATQDGPACPQTAGGDPAAKASVDEDCLRLNVFAPAGAPRAKRPVMVWIHGGGGGNSGYGGAKQYDPSAIVKEGGIVAVNINYRLGVLAMLATSSLTENGELSGNYGVRDQQAALRWVQKNIAAFGGDPNNVTIVGGTAGGGSVLVLVASPRSKGLFAKAITQSPQGAPHVSTRAAAEATGAELADALGCKAGQDQAACLRQAPVEKLLSARGGRLRPAQDAALLPLDTFEAFRDGAFNRVPMIVGSTLREGYLSVSEAERRLGHPMTVEEVTAQIRSSYGANADAVLKLYSPAAFPSPAAAAGELSGDASFACYVDTVRAAVSKYAPVYGFEMDEPNPAQQQPREKISLENSAYHTTELAYLFDIAATGRLTGKDAALGKKMRAYWSQFMRTGAPGGAGLPPWPRFRNGAVLNLSNAGGVTTDFTARHQCLALQKLGIVYTGTK